MENQESVDQLPPAIRQFFVKHHDALGQRGSIVATWRRRGAGHFGPYYRLTLRDPSGRQRSVYLGSAGGLVEHVRRQLTLLQAAHRERRQLACVRRQLAAGLADARRQLDRDLAGVGLRRQGSEIRGWTSIGSPSATHRHDLDQPQALVFPTKATRP